MERTGRGVAVFCKRSRVAMVEGMRDIVQLLERWQLDVGNLRESMYRASTPRERERWHGLWLLAQGWSATQVAEALEREPRSIAEVRLREAEVSKLRDWARSLGPSAAEADLRSFQKIPAASCTVVELFGLVIFALIGEVTRRQAQDGQIWSVVRRGFRDDTQPKLRLLTWSGSAKKWPWHSSDL